MALTINVMILYRSESLLQSSNDALAAGRKGQIMIKRGRDHGGENFVRVILLSGSMLNPLGCEELTIFCKCTREESTSIQVDQAGLLHWVNSNPSFKKNQSNEPYRISKNIDAMIIISLSNREIQACRTADRLFACS